MSRPPIHLTDEQRLMVEKNINLVRWYISKHPVPMNDYDDTFQTGCIGLMKAACKYDQAKGTTFATFAVACIQNEIRMVRRAANSMGRCPAIPITSLNTRIAGQGTGDLPDCELQDLIADPSATIDEVMEYRSLHEFAREILDKDNLLRDVYENEMSQRAIAMNSGLTQGGISRRVSKRIDAARKALEIQHWGIN